MNNPRILIVDDHALVRGGVRQLLLAEFKHATVEEAADAPAALQKIFKTTYDLVLLDLGLPGRSGLMLLEDVKKVFPHLPVLILSAHEEDELAVRLLKAGAAGYVSKGGPPSEVVEAVRKALTGARYISPAMAQFLANEIGRDSDAKPAHELLSDREYEVLCLISNGKTNGEIARALCLSVKTVSTYRNRLLEKMHLSTNAEITRYAIKNELVAM